MKLTYKKAGVDVHNIENTQDMIGKMIASTHMQNNLKVTHGFGHYAGIIDVNGTLLAMHTDGVGTKVIIACMMEKYDTIGIDCVAMNVNDIICMGATPISFVDYIAVNKNDPHIMDIVKGLVDGAKKSSVPIIGGETSIMPDLITGDNFAFDLAGSVIGIIKKKPIIGDDIQIGDIIIGASSTGLHSNGYSLARKALLPKYSLSDNINGIGILGDMLLTPTEIYVKPVLEIIDKCNINGLAHITGGSFTKLLRLKNIGYDITLPEMPPIMKLIAEQGAEDMEMYKTFNMGIGFCIIAPKNQSNDIISTFKHHGIASSIIGKTTNNKGVVVNSKKIA